MHEVAPFAACYIAPPVACHAILPAACPATPGVAFFVIPQAAYWVTLCPKVFASNCRTPAHKTYPYMLLYFASQRKYLADTISPLGHSSSGGLGRPVRPYTYTSLPGVPTAPINRRWNSLKPWSIQNSIHSECYYPESLYLGNTRHKTNVNTMFQPWTRPYLSICQVDT